MVFGAVRRHAASIIAKWRASVTTADGPGRRASRGSGGLAIDLGFGREQEVLLVEAGARDDERLTVLLRAREELLAHP